MHLHSESVVKRNRCPIMQSITEAHNFIVNCGGCLGAPNRNSSSVFTVVERKPLDGEAGGVHVFPVLIPHGRRLDHPTEMEALLAKQCNAIREMVVCHQPAER